MDPLYEKLTKELANPVEVIKFENNCENEEETKVGVLEITDETIREHLSTMDNRNNSVTSDTSNSRDAIQEVTLKRKETSESVRTKSMEKLTKRLKAQEELKVLKALAAQYGLEPFRSQQNPNSQQGTVEMIQKIISSPTNNSNDWSQSSTYRTTQEKVFVQKPTNVRTVAPRIEQDYGLDNDLDHNLLILESLQTLEDQNRLIIEQNNTIMNQNYSIADLVKKLNGSDVKLQNTLYQPLDGFPMKTMEDFNSFCEAKDEVLQKVHDHLVHLGGSKLREFLSCAMKNLMTDELVSHFSWTKGPNAEKFGDTKFSNLLFVSAQKCPSFEGPATKNDYKMDMQEVLRSAKQRYRNSLKKNNEELFEKIASLEQMQRDGQDEISFVVDDDSTEVPESDF